MSQDEEMLQLFKVECEEHLQRLEEGLLDLEANPDNSALLEEMFREAHSIKGAASMVGVSDVERIGHHFEDVLGAAKRSEIVLTAEMVNPLYENIDTIRLLVLEAVAGDDAAVDVESVVEQIKLVNLEDSPGAPGSEEAAAGTAPGAEVGGGSLPTATIAQTAAIDPSGQPEKEADVVAVDAGLAEYRIDTMRVDARKLDNLMRQTAEMNASKIRLDHRLREIEDLVAHWEEWHKESAARRFVDGARGSDTKGFEKHRQAGDQRLEQMGRMLNSLRQSIYEDSTKLGFIVDELSGRIRDIRLLPISTLFKLFSRPVRDLSNSQGKDVQLIIEGGETTADKRVLEELKDPLMHLLRNAVDHGIEAPDTREQLGKKRGGTVWLRAYQRGADIVVEVVDDGKGLDLAKIGATALEKGLCQPEQIEDLSAAEAWELISSAGFSTRRMVTNISGRGVGMDVVRANVERLKGNIALESELGQGCTFRLVLPTALATARALVVTAAGGSYALPIEYVHTTSLKPAEDIFTIGGREHIMLKGRAVSIARLADLLELDDDGGHRSAEEGRASTLLPFIVLEADGEELGILVDALVDEQEVLIKPSVRPLKRVRNISGATILGTGQVCMVLNPHDLLRSVRTGRRQHRASEKPLVQERKKVILLVEDSITTRTQEKRILESAGYQVVTAVDGVDGFNKLGAQVFDGVVSDVEMPNLNGLGLAAKIRQNPKYRDLPLILVTSLASAEARRQGIEAGVNAYIAKPAFDQQVFLDTLERLV